MDIFSLMLVNLPNRRKYKTQDEGCLHIYMTLSLKEGYFLYSVYIGKYTPSFYIEVHTRRQESERSCIGVLMVSLLLFLRF